MQKVLSKETAFKRDWERKLTSQIHDLPMYDEVFRGAKDILNFEEMISQTQLTTVLFKSFFNQSIIQNI